MKKITSLSLFLFLIVFAVPLWALDPIAPKEERAFGFLSVESPLETDVCEITPLGKAERPPITFKSYEMVKVPVGEYNLKVKIQELDWTKQIKVTPTELTQIFVTGYGNLKVKTPHPDKDIVEVFDHSGRLVKSFPSSELKTLPAGNYRVSVKLSTDYPNPKDPKQHLIQQVTKNTSIITNETRRLVVSY